MPRDGIISVTKVKIKFMDDIRLWDAVVARTWRRQLVIFSQQLENDCCISGLGVQQTPDKQLVLVVLRDKDAEVEDGAQPPAHPPDTPGGAGCVQAEANVVGL